MGKLTYVDTGETVSEDEFYQRQGFENAAEAHRMISSVDLTDRKTWNYFEVWKEVDGTKKGLEKVLSVKDEP